MVYLPMSYLYGKRFVGPITPTVLSLRKELYTIPYREIDWNQARNLCAEVGQTNILVLSNLNFSSKDTFLIPLHDFALCSSTFLRNVKIRMLRMDRLLEKIKEKEVEAGAVENPKLLRYSYDIIEAC
jgi:hypothetical protein